MKSLHLAGSLFLMAITVLTVTASDNNAKTQPNRFRLDYNPQPVPVRYLTTRPGRHPVAVFKMLVERSNFRDNVEIAELIQEEGTVPPHTHRSDEIFHVLEGELIITVKKKGDPGDPKEIHLRPGMTGTIAKGDVTTHKVVTPHMRAMVIWAPGGEADHMLRVGFQSRPYIEGEPNPFHELLEQ